MNPQLDIFSVADAERIARKRLPHGVQLFFDGGTEAGLTLRENRRAFEDVLFLPRVAVRHERRELATTVLGQDLAFPLVLSPAGFIRFAHRDGEVGAARAAAQAGIAAGVSTMSSHDIVDVCQAAPGRVWYQVYFAGGRGAAEIAINQAARAGCSALLVTVDLAGHVRRETGKRGGSVTRQVDLTLARLYAGEVLRRPRWLVNFLRDGRRLDVPNVRLSPDGPPLSVAEASAVMRTSTPTWDDVAWIREAWSGPLCVKGVLRPEDACRARDLGADGVVVSNHGGNALDGAVASLRALPGVVDAVGSDIDVLLDGGVRRGTDVVKALALGAKAVLMGRPYVWGLAAGGTAGVSRIIDLLHDGVDGALGLLGCPSVHDLDPSYLDLPLSWPRRP